VRRILDVGCGEFASAPVLSRLFPDALLVGMDLNWGILHVTPGRVRIVADGAALPFATFPGFDLILVRHPDVDRRPQGWQRVGMMLCGYLGERGRVVVTCYSRYELDALRAVLIQVGLAALALDQKTLPPVDLVGQDRVVLGLARPVSTAVGRSNLQNQRSNTC
jgi:hypothetical protein